MQPTGGGIFRSGTLAVGKCGLLQDPVGGDSAPGLGTGACGLRAGVGNGAACGEELK